ncbi:MAG: tetratricopeptide repeat protein [Pseudomonadota bacterium]
MFFKIYVPRTILIAALLFPAGAGAAQMDYKKHAEEIAGDVAALTAEKIPDLTKQAEANDARAQLLLGFAYFYGQGVTRDYQAATQWFEKAAQQGDVLAQYQLAVDYANGVGGKQNFAQAVHWYAKAAAQGFAEAQFRLGTHYRMGEGVPQDDAEALRWFREAARQNHAEAQWSVGLMYHSGIGGVEKNHAEAVKWYRQAAEQGLGKAEYYLATLYEVGKGVPQDFIMAYMWYTIAVAKGEPVALRFKTSLAKQMTPEQIDEAQRQAEQWLEQHP